MTNTPPNPERMRFIDHATAMKVADELRGETRLIFLLARFAGLRITSETNALKWEDVDFAGKTIRVYAAKTKRTRTIPMLPVVIAGTGAKSGAARQRGRARHGQKNALRPRGTVSRRVGEHFDGRGRIRPQSQCIGENADSPACAAQVRVRGIDPTLIAKLRERFPHIPESDWPAIVEAIRGAS